MNIQSHISLVAWWMESFPIPIAVGKNFYTPWATVRLSWSGVFLSLLVPNHIYCLLLGLLLQKRLGGVNI